VHAALGKPGDGAAKKGDGTAGREAIEDFGVGET